MQGDSWLSWHDAASGECFGESKDQALALELARRVAVDGVVDGPRTIVVYHEPGHLPLWRIHADGTVEELAGANSSDPKPRAGHGARHAVKPLKLPPAS